MSFIPENAVDPLFKDKAYVLAHDKPGGKPYHLLQEALHISGRCALAKRAWNQTVRRQMRATDVDSCDNALAETVNGPNKPNCITAAPLETKESLELTRLEWVSWFKTTGPHRVHPAR